MPSCIHGLCKPVLIYYSALDWPKDRSFFGHINSILWSCQLFPRTCYLLVVLAVGVLSGPSIEKFRIIFWFFELTHKSKISPFCPLTAVFLLPNLSCPIGVILKILMIAEHFSYLQGDPYAILLSSSSLSFSLLNFQVRFDGRWSFDRVIFISLSQTYLFSR